MPVSRIHVIKYTLMIMFFDVFVFFGKRKKEKKCAISTIRVLNMTLWVI